MNKQGLLKNLVLSFLPLLIFVLAEDFLDGHFPEAEATRYALFLGIGMGLLQAIYIFVKEKRLDRMVLMDTALIVLMGSISLISGDDIFFKLKPALVQFVSVIILAVPAFLEPNLLVLMSGRVMQGIEIQDEQLKAMQKSAKGLVIFLLLHTCLILYAAFYLSKGDWAFISGPLLYIVLGVYFVGMLAIGRWRSRKIRSAGNPDEPRGK